jgi:hypothetical protein
MKYLKRINELFDDSDLRDANEIPYLTGDISPETVSKWKKVKSDDPLLDRVIFSCPFVVGLNYRRNGNILEFGFNSNIDNGFYYFTCEVVEFRNVEFGLNAYTRCIIDNNKLWDESFIKRTDNFVKLCSYLNRDILDLLVRFNNFLKSEFGISHYDIDQEGVDVFNPRLN